MNYPGPRDAADARQSAGAVVQKRVDKRPFAISGGWMDHQAGGLVDDQQMIVLKHDRQWNVLRLVMCRLGFGNGERIVLAAADFCGGVTDSLASGHQRARPDQGL